MPIYNINGQKDKALLYRPISFCSTIDKTIERIVKDQLLILINNSNNNNKNNSNNKLYSNENEVNTIVDNRITT